MSIEDEARAEAEKRYPTRLPYNAEFEKRALMRDAFMTGAEWQASRTPKLADSKDLRVAESTDRDAVEGAIRAADALVNGDRLLLSGWPGFLAEALAARGFSRTPEAAPSDTDREAMELRIADTLAYYECRKNNPKADHPRMGYHAFSEGQRQYLRDDHREAAAEVSRIVFESRTSQPVQVEHECDREKAIAKALSIIDRDVAALANLDPTELRVALTGRATSQPVQVEVTDEMVMRAASGYAAHVTGYSMRDGGYKYTCQCGWSHRGDDAQAEAQKHRSRAALEAVLGGGE